MKNISKIILAICLALGLTSVIYADKALEYKLIGNPKYQQPLLIKLKVVDKNGNIDKKAKGSLLIPKSEHDVLYTARIDKQRWLPSISIKLNKGEASFYAKSLKSYDSSKFYEVRVEDKRRKKRFENIVIGYEIHAKSKKKKRKKDKRRILEHDVKMDMPGGVETFKIQYHFKKDNV